MPIDQQKMVAFVSQTSAALETAHQQLKQAEAEKQAAKASVSLAAQALLDAGLISAAEVKTAEKQLANHAEALGILGNVISAMGKREEDARKTASAVSLGKPAGQPAAAKPMNADEMFYERIVHGVRS